MSEKCQKKKMIKMRILKKNECALSTISSFKNAHFNPKKGRKIHILSKGNRKLKNRPIFDGQLRTKKNI